MSIPTWLQKEPKGREAPAEEGWAGWDGSEDGAEAQDALPAEGAEDWADNAEADWPEEDAEADAFDYAAWEADEAAWMQQEQARRRRGRKLLAAACMVLFVAAAGGASLALIGGGGETVDETPMEAAPEVSEAPAPPQVDQTPAVASSDLVIEPAPAAPVAESAPVEAPPAVAETAPAEANAAAAETATLAFSEAFDAVERAGTEPAEAPAEAAEVVPPVLVAAGETGAGAGATNAGADRPYDVAAFAPITEPVRLIRQADGVEEPQDGLTTGSTEADADIAPEPQDSGLPAPEAMAGGEAPTTAPETKAPDDSIVAAPEEAGEAAARGEAAGYAAAMPEADETGGDAETLIPVPAAVGETSEAAMPARPENAAETGETVLAATRPAPDAEEPEAAAAPDAVPANAPAGRVKTFVNMRAGPDNGAAIVSVLREGSAVRIVSCDYWCEVDAGGKRGWVYKSFIERTAEARTATR